MNLSMSLDVVNLRVKIYVSSFSYCLIPIIFIVFHKRKAEDAATQKNWADSQKREMNEERSRQAAEDSNYAAQTDAITRMRGLLEDEATAKKANAMKEMQAMNKRLA